jgi:hypothetical protein
MHRRPPPMQQMLSIPPCRESRIFSVHEETDTLVLLMSRSFEKPPQSGSTPGPGSSGYCCSCGSPLPQPDEARPIGCLACWRFLGRLHWGCLRPQRERAARRDACCKQHMSWECQVRWAPGHGTQRVIIYLCPASVSTRKMSIFLGGGSVLDPGTGLAETR